MLAEQVTDGDDLTEAIKAPVRHNSQAEIVKHSSNYQSYGPLNL